MTQDIVARRHLRALPHTGLRMELSGIVRHERRAPLTVLLGHATAAADGDRLVRRPTDLLAVADDVAGSVRRRALRRGVRIRLPRPVAGVRAVVDPDKVHSALLVLLVQAVQHAPAGSRVDIEVSRDETMAAVAVRDQGPGIPSEDRAGAFGSRLPVDVTQSVLLVRGPGLSVADLVARSHGGALRLESNHPQGLCARLELPLEQLLMSA